MKNRTLDPRIQLVLVILEQRSSYYRVSSSSMSTLLGISQERFLRVFRLNVGRSFSLYLREVKILQAARLIEEHDLSIKEISHQCGYADISNFYRDFRNILYTTPHDLRQMHLKSRCGFEGPHLLTQRRRAAIALSHYERPRNLEALQM